MPDLVVGTVPAVVLGLAFNDFIESNLGNVQLVGWMLVIGGIFMLFCDKIFNKGSEQTKFTYKRALTIGFIQCIAMHSWCVSFYVNHRGWYVSASYS